MAIEISDFSAGQNAPRGLNLVPMVVEQTATLDY